MLLFSPLDVWPSVKAIQLNSNSDIIATYNNAAGWDKESGCPGFLFFKLAREFRSIIKFCIELPSLYNKLLHFVLLEEIQWMELNG